MTRPYPWKPKYPWLDALGLINRGPRTVAELVELTGCTRQTMYRYLKAFREEGLIDPFGNKFCWQWRHTPKVEEELTLNEQWNLAGREPYPFHPSASHVPPNYRDGWNAALAAVAKKQNSA